MARPHSEPKHWLDIGYDYHHGSETDKKALAEKYHVSLSHVRNALKFYENTLKDMVENWPEAGGTGVWDWSLKPSDELRYRLMGLLPSGRSGGAREARARTGRRGRPRSEPKDWLDIGYDYHHGSETDKKALAAKYRCSLRHVGNALAFYNQAFQETVRDWPPEAGYRGLEKPSYKLIRKIIGVICAAKK